MYKTSGVNPGFGLQRLWRYHLADHVAGGRISMRQTALIFAVVCAVLVPITPGLGQHTLSAKFDVTKPLTIKGTVTQIDWANPYVHILMKVPDTPRPTLWAVEVDGAINLARNGWSETALAPGDTITVQGFAARDGSKQISGNTVTVNGKKVYSDRK